jgi:hypothetical protein
MDHHLQTQGRHQRTGYTVSNAGALGAYGSDTRQAAAQSSLRTKVQTPTKYQEDNDYGDN